jgi:predicted transcriptional regulator
MPAPKNDLLSAEEAAYSGLPLTIEDPSDSEIATGRRRFSYTESEWTVHGQARLEGNAVRLLSIEVQPMSPEGVVTASMVNRIPVGRIVGSLQTLLTLDRARRGGAESVKAETPEPKSLRRGGRPRVTDEQLRALAEAYLAETAEGKPARPVARIAEQLGRPEETVRTWLARARKEGWLAPGVKGRAGGEPGSKLLAARMADELELGPHPEGEPLSEKIAREGRRAKKLNEGVEKWEEMRRMAGLSSEDGPDDWWLTEDSGPQ